LVNCNFGLKFKTIRNLNYNPQFEFIATKLYNEFTLKRHSFPAATLKHPDKTGGRAGVKPHHGEREGLQDAPARRSLAWLS
jgi:hypothetical protein